MVIQTFNCGLCRGMEEEERQAELKGEGGLSGGGGGGGLTPGIL